MHDPALNRERRRALELMLAEVVVALREHCAEGNITVRVPKNGGLGRHLKVDDQEAVDLAKLLRSQIWPLPRRRTSIPSPLVADRL